MKTLITTVVLFTAAYSAPGYSQSSIDWYFQRHHVLAKKFPHLFYDYNDLNYLVPTAKATFDRKATDPKLSIAVRLTPLGRSNERQIAISSWYRPEANQTMALSNVEIPTIFPPIYAWSVLIAEVMTEFPGARRFQISLSSAATYVATGPCADLLATTGRRYDAVKALPVSSAFSKLGFRLSGYKIDSSHSRPGEAHWPGEFDLLLTFER